MLITLIGESNFQFTMIKIKKPVANGYYLFQGKASANSSFIEDLSEAKRFIILANYYFKGYLKIHEYILTQDGWNFIVKINSAKSIAAKHASDSIEDFDESLIWKIISERVRIFLSTFVKFTNKKQGRTGSKVHSSYERFMFESLSEALGYIEKIRQGAIKLYQSKRKYKAKKSHYRIPRKLGRGSIFLSSRKLRDRVRRVVERLEVLELQVSSKHVLRKLIKSTFKYTPKRNPPPFFNNS